MRHHVTRIQPYTPDQLFALVGDIESYPKFVPWLTGMRTWNHRTDSEGVSWADAEAKVGFSFLRERFSTRVRRDPSARVIDVGLLSGPFTNLKNRWAFFETPAGTRVEFDIEFSFKTRLLEGLLSRNFEAAVGKLMACFDARAVELYGPGA
ncbi:type II toxin-antitoxin system RatA family toxin [Phenylobacterium aquaticum]|uniref:type II toxin-antitoxin system RatA family toxin n=1 Tax=Phenylobacterium aquaticum TaxID=1763816 RepID=UPI0026EAD7D5|nr:SRPBCC family protein [Phenylobacterium aquaticum]